MNALESTLFNDVPVVSELNRVAVPVIVQHTVRPRRRIIHNDRINLRFRANAYR